MERHNVALVLLSRLQCQYESGVSEADGGNASSVQKRHQEQDAIMDT